MKQTILAVTPYIIDIPISIGGTLALHARSGDDVYGLAMIYPGGPSRVVFPEARRNGKIYGRFETAENFERDVARVEKNAVARILGMKEILTFDFQAHEQALFERAAVERTAAVLNELQPDVIITYWPVSNYTDFSGATMAVMRVLTEHKLAKMPRVFFAETLPGRHTLCFQPSVYVDVTAVLPVKREAAAQIWDGKAVDYYYNVFSLPSSEWRGREAGCPHAEAFVPLHGGFGELKRLDDAVSGVGAEPMGLTRATESLPMHKMVRGLYPANSGATGILDSETAAKVYYQP